MRSWGKESKKHFDTLDPRLQRVMTRVRDEVADISILQGHRGQAAQNEAFYGTPQRSKLPWPKGKHNKLPSVAVDFQPYPRPDNLDKLTSSLAYIAGAAVMIGREEGVVIRWGGDWDKDGSLMDQNFDDYFHLEIVEDEKAARSTDTNGGMRDDDSRVARRSTN